MIPIQLWRARIGLFNAKCRSGGGSSSSFSFRSSCLSFEQLQANYSTDKHLPSSDHDCALGFSSEISSSTPAVRYISHKQSAKGAGLQTTSIPQTGKLFPARLWSRTVHSLFSSLNTDRLYLPNDLLKDAVVILLIAIISQLLVQSGDIETNPGPIASDKPTIKQLISLKKADGENLRIIDWITSLPHSKCEDFAHFLLDDIIKVMTHQKLSTTDEFVRAVLLDWLSSGDDARAVSCTWAALADCMKDAGLPGDLVKAIRDICALGMMPQVNGKDVGMPSANLEKSMIFHRFDSSKDSIMEHGPIKVIVKPDVPEKLLALMEEYSDMVVVLQTVILPEQDLERLKLFLYSFCSFDKTSFEDGSSLKEIVNQLIAKLKIYIFNIDTLTACCKYFKSDEVSHCIQQYKKHLDVFMSTTSVRELQSSLQTEEVTCLNAEPLTLKLNETVSDDTLLNLKKLVYHFFGDSSKALIIRNIHSGCVCITWIIPASLVSTFKVKAQQLSPEDLASRGVLELVIGLRIAPNEGFAEPMVRNIPVQESTERKDNLWFKQKLEELEKPAPVSKTEEMNSEAFSTLGELSTLEYTGVYAIREYTHIKEMMLDKYKDMVRELKSKEDIIAALLDPHCKKIFVFAGSKYCDWDEIYREVESRGFNPDHSPKITQVIFTNYDLTGGCHVEAGRVKLVVFDGKEDEPDFLGKLMMIGNYPVLKKEMPQKLFEGTITTQEEGQHPSRNEPDFPLVTEEYTSRILHPPVKRRTAKPKPKKIEQVEGSGQLSAVIKLQNRGIKLMENIVQQVNRLKLVFKKETPHRPSEGTISTQESRNESDFSSTVSAEHPCQAGSPSSDHSAADSPLVTYVKSEIDLSESQKLSPSPVKQERHQMAAQSMQLHVGTAKPKQIEQVEGLQLMSTSSPSAVVNTARIEDLLTETIELHKREISLMESINQRHAKMTADKTEELVELTDYIDTLQIHEPDLPCP